jgi:hypothetical protein
MRISTRTRKTLYIGSAVLILLTAIVGWMHTKAARPVLAAIGVHCPVDEATPTDVAAIREKGLGGLRGKLPAPLRPTVDGMPLESFSERDAQKWAASNHVNCETVVHGMRYLRCRGVDGKVLGVAGPPVSELWLSFGLSGKLIGVDIYRRGLDPQGETIAWSDAIDRLQSKLGEPAVKFGDASPAVLSATNYLTARVQYRYSDYVATVTAVKLPYAGLAVREQYMSAKS